MTGAVLYDTNGNFDLLAWSGLTPELYARWKEESANGTRDITPALDAAIRAYVFARDRPAPAPTIPEQKPAPAPEE